MSDLNSPRHFTTVNPSTGDVLAERDYANESDIDRSLQKLEAGLIVWKKKSVSDRQKILGATCDEFKKLKSEFTLAMTKTMGKPVTQSEAEFDKCIHAIDYLCKLDIDVLKTKTISDSTRRHEVRRDPVGIIVGVMPWNFPMWQAIRMIFPTLIAGNTVLLKHSEITSEIGDLFLKVFVQTNMQHNIFDHQMFSHTTTEKIISDARVGGISLAGSIHAGKTVSELAGRHLKKGVFELGGSDPSLVFADCDLDQTIGCVLRSRFLNSGQVCISTKRVFVERSILNKFLDKMITSFRNYKADDPMKRSTTLGPLAHVRFKKEFDLQMQSLAMYSEIVAENKMDIAPKDSAYVSPRILLFKKHIDFFKTNEIFGPALCLIPFESEIEALSQANSTIFGLGASLYTQDQKRIDRWTRDLDAGQVAVNNFVTSDVRLPFGGKKHSGLGRELGDDGFMEFSQTKVVSYELGST
jgi:succinate-semialdehyde dehydrogenase / glutarate-semialdehyde dehydrogenase